MTEINPMAAAWLVICTALLIIVLQVIKMRRQKETIDAYVNHDIHEEAEVLDCLDGSETLRRIRETVPGDDRGQKRKFLQFCRDINTLRKFRAVLRSNPDFDKRYGDIAKEIEDHYKNIENDD